MYFDQLQSAKQLLKDVHFQENYGDLIPYIEESIGKLDQQAAGEKLLQARRLLFHILRAFLTARPRDKITKETILCQYLTTKQTDVLLDTLDFLNDT